MKKILWLLCILGIAVYGCIASDDGGEGKGNGSGDIVGDYLPGKLIGTSYTWKSTLADPSGGSVTSTHTVRISDTVVNDGNTYYLAHYDTGELYNRFRVEDDGFHITMDGTMYGLHEDGYPYGNPPSVDYCFFDFGVSKDVERTIMDWGSKTDSMYVNYVIKGMYLGPASVTVPAGSFTDCRQFKVTPSLTFTPIVTGNGARISRVEYHWFAKGIGPVKREIEIWSNNKLYKKLTEELVSYSLP